MRVTFPHMSPVIVYKKLVELLGHTPVVPPVPTQKTIDLGVKYSPEFACFPLKVIMGSYIETLQNNDVDFILTSGGNGPCRAGYYGELHQKILDNLGMDIEVVIFDSIFKNFKDFIRKAKLLKGDNSLLKVIQVLRVVYHLAYGVDNADKRLHKIQPYEVNEGECRKVWEKALEIYDKVTTLDDVFKANKQVNEMIDAIKTIEVPEEKKLRVGIVGEIYVVLEPSVNMDVENVLNKLGVETERSQYLSEWINFNAIPKPFKDKKVPKVLEKGTEFIEIQIGGHAKETVGFIKDFKDRGFDGIVHLMPFGCLPELVTQSVAPSMSKILDIPVLTIPIDEQTGKANNLTRLEAFVDLLKNKKAANSSKASA